MSTGTRWNEYGIIRDPGKFEGEPVYLLHFYDLVGDGCGDTHYDGDTPTDFFIIDSDDQAQYPDLEGAYGLAMWESDSGFVNHEIFATQREYDAAIELLDSQAASDDEEGGAA